MECKTKLTVKLKVIISYRLKIKVDVQGSHLQETNIVWYFPSNLIVRDIPETQNEQLIGGNDKGTSPNKDVGEAAMVKQLAK